MASLLSPRRQDRDIALHATVPQDQRTAPPDHEPEPSPVGSWLAALGGGLAAAVCGWVLVVGLTVVGWLVTDPGSFAGAVAAGTQLWLLANGAGARLGSTSVTLIPWGATALLALVVSRFAAYAARATRGRRSADAARVTALLTSGYALPVVVTALISGEPLQALRALVAVLVIAGCSAAWGSCRSLSGDLTRRWPQWCRAVPRAVLSAQLAMLVAGSAALTAGLVLHLHRVVALTQGLGVDTVGAGVLLLAQLAYAPNAAVWAASYTLGAGFTVGQGSWVALSSTQLGLLPAVPLLGALPAVGPGSTAGLCWLLSGVLAGAVAAWVVTRARPAARCDQTCVVGALSGIVAGVVFVALAWASGGDLGELRLSGLGPRLLPLLLMSTTVMGLSGMVVGLVLGLWRRALGPPERNRP